MRAAFRPLHAVWIALTLTGCSSDPALTTFQDAYVQIEEGMSVDEVDVIFSQMAADLPENYENQPAFEFIREVQVDWDETRVLNGEIGDFVTIARRRGACWYIGSIPDEMERTLTLSLSFLDKDRNYRAWIYADGKGADWETKPTAIDIRDEVVTSDTVLTAWLAPGGGQAIIIKPVQ